MSDIDSLLDSTLDDLEDLPEFKPFPPGAHQVSISLELKKINDKDAVEMTLKGIATLELVEPTKDEPIKEGDETSIVFFLDNEFARGNMKKLLTPIGEALGNSKIRDVIEQTKGLECLAITSLRKNKDDADKPYMNVKEIRVL